MGKYSGVSPEEFVRVYQTSESIQEVADKTGMTVMAVHSRSAHYRREYGVPLKKMAGQRSKVDAEALRNLCAELQAPAANGEAHAAERPKRSKRRPAADRGAPKAKRERRRKPKAVEVAANQI
jgi:hypothetical protein